MEMNKKLCILSCIIMIIFLCGCLQEGAVTVDDTDYHRGTRGLEMYFIPNAQPNQVYDGDHLDIMVELKNMGAYPGSDIFDGKLEISGFDPNAISGSCLRLHPPPST